MTALSTDKQILNSTLLALNFMNMQFVTNTVSKRLHTHLVDNEPCMKGLTHVY